MVIADFQVENKGGRPRFFQETFLVTDTKFEVILGMLFLKLSNTNVLFGEKTLMWRSYTTNKVLPISKQMQLIDQKKFVIMALDAGSKTFVMHVAIKEQKEMPVHSERQAQIKTKVYIDAQGQSGAQVEVLLFNKAPIEIPTEYSDYSNVFSTENATELLENTGINEHAIKLEEDKQPSFGPIYSLGLVEWETLKTYIKTILANSFIHHSISSKGAPILFDRKQDASFCLYMDYWGFNNITIKN